MVDINAWGQTLADDEVNAEGLARLEVKLLRPYPAPTAQTVQTYRFGERALTVRFPPFR